MHSGGTYKLLPASNWEGSVGFPPVLESRGSERTCVRGRNLVLAVQTLLILLLGTALFWAVNQDRSQCQLLYSPAQEAIAFEVKRWAEDIWTPNVYKDEPSDTVDKAWEDLYNDFGISQIPKWQAALLPNHTLPIPADPANHIIQLSVFHQMHCLNVIRRALRPEYYIDPVTGDLGGIKQAILRDHLNHCVDSIRQGIMCASDISPIVWQWSDEDERAKINMDVVHSCRSYEKVVDWAKEHRMVEHFDVFQKAEGASIQ